MNITEYKAGLAHMEAYDCGFQACIDGETPHANPYASDDPRYDDWSDGWDAAYEQDNPEEDTTP